jgi:transcription antitermination factor NusG
LLKEHDNPPVTYPAEASIMDFSGQWWVAHTKSRNEKALANDLILRGIPYFLPMTWTVTRKTHRPVRSLMPIFMGYMFFCGDDDHRVEVLQTHRVANIIDVVDQIEFITQLSQVEKAIKADVPLTQHHFVKKGQWCRVVAGSLMGLEGIVEDLKGVTRLILQVSMLGQATSVEIAADMVEVIEASHKGPDNPPLIT